MATEPSIKTLDRDIDRIAGRLIAHRSIIVALAAIITGTHPNTPRELHDALGKPSDNHLKHPPATLETLDEEVAILLRRIDEATGRAPAPKHP